MKRTTHLLSLILFLFLFQSFVLEETPKELKNYELKNNEVIHFQCGFMDPKVIYSSIIRRSSYDGTRYRIDIDTAGKITLSGVMGCLRKNQNELALYRSTGTISRHEDTIQLEVNSLEEKLYLISVQKDGLMDTMTSAIKIKLVTNTLNNEYCPSLIRTSNSSAELVAIPKDIKIKAMYKASHIDKAIGLFTYFAIQDANGLSKVYPPGDYLIVGGNSLQPGNLSLR